MFPGLSFCPEWFENHPDIVYLIFLFLCRLTNNSLLVLQCLQMAGQMISLVQSGLRNPSFPRWEQETSLGSLSFSFLTVIARTKHHVFFTLLKFIISSFSVFLLTPRTSCSLLMLVYLVHCRELGWSNVIVLSNSLVQRCLKRILSTSTCRLDKGHLDPASLSLCSRKVGLGPSTGEFSPMMITHPASHIWQKLKIFLHCPSQTTQIQIRALIQILILTSTLILNHALYIHISQHYPHHANHHLSHHPLISLPHLLQLAAFPIRLPLHNSTMIQSSLTTFTNLKHRCSNSQGKSKWFSWNCRTISEIAISGMAGQANDENSMFRQES